MTRDVLRVDGVSTETKNKLKAQALKKLGQANASALVRTLIAEELNKNQQPSIRNFDLAGASVRIEIRLPASVIKEIETLAENKFSNRNKYISNVIYEHLGKSQLDTNQVEVLRRSNYELAKIGSNLNQIAKAFNIIVKLGGDSKLPEIGRKISSIRNDIKLHTSKVLNVLEAKTINLESKMKIKRK